MNQQPLSATSLNDPTGTRQNAKGVAYLLATTAAYFVLGAQPWAGSLFTTPWDKAAHFAVYSVLTSWLILMRGSFSISSVFALVATIALVDELAQMFMPARSAEFMDWLADACAAALTCLWAHHANSVKKQ